MMMMDRNIWRSSISVSTKIRLCSVYVLPVLLYGSETWTMTKATSAKVDAFDMWCQRRILRIHYRQHVTNTEVRHRTGCPPLSDTIRSRRLRLFGHVARAGSEMDYCRALRAAIHGPPRDWRRRRKGRPAHTWTRTVEADLKGSRTFRPLDVSPPGRFAHALVDSPWTFRPIDVSPIAWTIRTLDVSLQDVSPTAWTIRTINRQSKSRRFRLVMTKSIRL